MPNIIIGFSKPKKFSIHGWIIEKIDNVPFDHVYLRFNLDKIQKNIIFQSIFVGVQIVTENEFEGLCTPLEEYTLSITDVQFIEMLQFCFDKAGKPYGILDVMGLGISKILSRLNIKDKNPFNEGDANYFCSQIIAKCLNTIDPTQFNIDPDNTSPSDLNKLLNILDIQRTL